MEAEQKHSCKVCGKTFSSGRSLGGHMRSHLSLPSADPPAPAPASAYGLRENPKKTRRFSDSIPSGASSPSRDKVCRECGRGFPSWNSLFGHMRSHSGGRNSHAQVAEEQEEDGSLWKEAECQSDDEGVMALRRARRRSRRVASIPPSWSSEECEKEQEDVAVSLMMLSRDFGSWSGVIAAGESSDKNSVVWEDKGVSEEECEIERGKVGSGLGKGRCRDEQKKANSEVVDDGVVIIVDEEGEDVPQRAKLGAFDAHASELLQGEALEWKPLNSSVAEVKRKGGFFRCDSESELHTSSKKMNLGDGEGDHIVRGGYQCATCQKSFHSYQALGGHRASYHKKLKSCSTSGIDVVSENNSTETDATIEAEAVDITGRVDYCNVGKKSSKGLKNKAKVHECPICHKVFPSGQALGGHKRSHLIVNAGNGGSSSTVFPQTIVIQHQNQPPGMPDLIDLNLPAPVDEESTSTERNVEFKQWWRGHNSKIDRYLGMFSN